MKENFGDYIRSFVRVDKHSLCHAIDYKAENTVPPSVQAQHEDDNCKSNVSNVDYSSPGNQVTSLPRAALLL